MSQENCMDCGVLLSTHSDLCSGCGFDNNQDPAPETIQEPPTAIYGNNTVPDADPGF